MRVVTFGELLLRLTPPDGRRFAQTEKFDAYFGGAEANVAAALACFGVETAFVTKLPANEIGQAAIDALRRYGVDTKSVLRGGERIGLYYYESGAGERGGKVIYDRAHSSVASALPEEFVWDAIFAGCDWFHVTGITPALSDACAEMTREAMRSARAHGCKISFDPNFRRSLWDAARAARVIDELSGYADVLITNMGQAVDVYGFSSDARDTDVAAALAERYGCEYVAMTARTVRSAAHNAYGALLYRSGVCARTELFEIEVKERIGAGDAFAAGLIFALNAGYTQERAVAFAVAAARMKHTIAGDVCTADPNEIERLARSETGEVLR